MDEQTLRDQLLFISLQYGASIADADGEPSAVEVVIQGIGDGSVTTAERKALRGALDAKEKVPLTDREVADAGLGRAIRRG